MSNPKVQEEAVIACDLSVFTDAQRNQHMADSQKLFSKVYEVQELSDGYALRLPDEKGMLSLIADFINDDSLCCPFFHFTMEVEPYRRGIWLKLGGSAEIKQLVAAEMSGLLNSEVATAAGLR